MAMHYPQKLTIRVAFASFLATGAASSVLAQAPGGKQNLGDMNLDQLMTVQVTTESKQAESLSKVPAAVYVISSEMIRRSGASTVPEVLRMAPGVQVSQMDASKYIVSIRGMGGRYSDKLLVLVDGRTVYTSLFSGVYWDAQDIDLAQISRIEVIRGPGGTLWGSNAVNGIINIITKKSSETLGTNLSVGSSTTEPYSANLSHGGQMAGGTYRVYSRAFKTSSLQTDLNTPGSDVWDGLRAGFRGDWELAGNSFSLSVDANSSHQGQTVTYSTLAAPWLETTTSRYATSEYSIQGKWERTAGKSTGTALRLSLDHYDRGTTDISERNTSVEMDYQQPLEIGRRNKFIWGLGYSSSRMQTFANPYALTAPPKATLALYSAFGHDEISLSDRLKLSLGSRFERNTFTGWEVQPSARMTFQPRSNQTFWGAISRAVRTPSIADEDISLFGNSGPGQGGLPMRYQFVGNPNAVSEVVVSHELGWRYEPDSNHFLDLSLFYNEYSHLRDAIYLGSEVVTTPFSQIVATSQFSNGASAQTAGFELTAHQSIRNGWGMDESYSLYTENFNAGSNNVFADVDLSKGVTPRNQLSVRSRLDLPRHMELDLATYYVSGIQTENVAPYFRLDLRLGWKPSKSTEISVGGTNLTSFRHLEAVSNLFDVSSSIQSSLYARVTLHF